MDTLTTRHRMIMCVTIMVLAAVAIFSINRFGSSSRVFGPVGTIQAQKIVKKRVNDPVDVYRIWKEAGYRGRTIVFVSDRWESFDPGELIPEQMFRAYPLQLYNTARLIEDNQLTAVTFLYVASLNKICRRIMAIMPDTEVDRMKAMARTSKDVRVSDKGVFVSRQGFPRWFMTGAGFRGDGEPVLLYVGASYFKTAEPEELFRQLASSGLETDCVILCNEAGKNSVSPKEIDKLDRFARLIGLSQSSEGSGGMTTSKIQMKQRSFSAS